MNYEHDQSQLLIKVKITHESENSDQNSTISFSAGANRGQECHLDELEVMRLGLLRWSEVLELSDFIQLLMTLSCSGEICIHHLARLNFGVISPDTVLQRANNEPKTFPTCLR